MNQKSRKPVLIANRGEIAIRVARTAKALGFPTVAIYSDADRTSEHVQICDQAYALGGTTPKESYLDIEKVIQAAKKSGALYIHPGFGFLSERAHFVEACHKAGLIFVGPTAESMRVMGDKIQARKTVSQLNVPGVPGSPGAVQNWKEALDFAKKIGFPVLLKAAAGGGGKGMRRVDKEEDLASSFEQAARESLGAFGDGALYVEKYILEPHHVEVQVFGDGKGGAIHLGERECSIQRRHQKVWEESPSPILNKYPDTRKKMYEAALKITRHICYAGAGTFEFIVDGEGHFYFLEMNTRLQVEHPVTEWVTGVDLVAMQLKLAAGEFVLGEIPKQNGSSIEVRLYAEDPHHFLPSPGPLGLIKLPMGSFVRSDAAITMAGEVSVHYDPMIAKVSVWAPSREEAIARLRVALDETRIESPKKNWEKQGSLKTNLSFLRRLTRNKMVLEGDTPTDLIPRNSDLTAESPHKPLTEEAALCVALADLLLQGGNAAEEKNLVWSIAALREGIRL